MLEAGARARGGRRGEGGGHRTYNPVRHSVSAGRHTCCLTTLANHVYIARGFRTCSVREEGVTSLWRGISARSLRLVMAVFILGETQQILSQQFEKIGFV